MKIRYNIINWLTNTFFDLWEYLNKKERKYYFKYYIKQNEI
jgi:hypothetical protein